MFQPKKFEQPRAAAPEASAEIVYSDLDLPVRNLVDRLAANLKLKVQTLGYDSVNAFQARAEKDIKSGTLTRDQIFPILELVREMEEIRGKNEIPQIERDRAIGYLHEAERIIQGLPEAQRDIKLCALVEAFLAANKPMDAFYVARKITNKYEQWNKKIAVVTYKIEKGLPVTSEISEMENELPVTIYPYYAELAFLRAKAGLPFKHLKPIMKIPSDSRYGEYRLKAYSNLAQAMVVSGEDPAVYGNRLKNLFLDDPVLETERGVALIRIGMMTEAKEMLSTPLQTYARMTLLGELMNAYGEKGEIDEALEILRTSPKEFVHTAFAKLFLATLRSHRDSDPILQKLIDHQKFFQGDFSERNDVLLELKKQHRLDLADALVNKKSVNSRIYSSLLKGPSGDHEDLIKQMEKSPAELYADDFYQMFYFLLKSWQGEPITDEALDSLKNKMFADRDGEQSADKLMMFGKILFLLGKNPLPLIWEAHKRMTKMRELINDEMIDTFCGMAFYQEADRFIRSIRNDGLRASAMIEAATTIVQPKDLILNS